MVCSGVAGERQRVRDNSESMAMVPERSKPLHNFTLPCLRWGNQKYLRCMKEESSSGGEVSAAGDRRSSGFRFADSFSSSSRRREEGYERKRLVREGERRTVKVAKSTRIDGEDDGIEAVREKLMFDLKTAADRMKDAILREEAAGDETYDVSVVAAAAPPPAGEARPWNLRTRRAACKAPGGGGVEEKKLNNSPLRSDGAVGVGVGSPEKKERPKFSVSLSRKEIEEDFMAILGERPPRRPKKRARNVQKQMDWLFPGLWLTEVSEDMYKVPEVPENGKR